MFPKQVKSGFLIMVIVSHFLTKQNLQMGVCYMIITNFAQTILKNQFQVAEGLFSSLYQFKPKSVDRKIKHGLQIVHCRRNHWILASNITNEEGIFNIYDYVYSSLDNDTQKVLANLFVFEEVRFVTFQKQVGGTDCGLFAIAATTQILSLKIVLSFTFFKIRCVLMLLPVMK